jgi:hypothetical protein
MEEEDAEIKVAKRDHFLLHGSTDDQIIDKLLFGKKRRMT